MTSATPGRRRRLTLNTAAMLATPADRDSTSGAIVASATPTGQRRRNQIIADAAAPRPASTTNTSSGAPGPPPWPGPPALGNPQQRPAARGPPPPAPAGAHRAPGPRAPNRHGPQARTNSRDRDTADRLAPVPTKAGIPGHRQPPAGPAIVAARPMRRALLPRHAGGTSAPSHGARERKHMALTNP